MCPLLHIRLDCRKTLILSEVQCTAELGRSPATTKIKFCTLGPQIYCQKWKKNDCSVCIGTKWAFMEEESDLITALCTVCWCVRCPAFTFRRKKWAFRNTCFCEIMEKPCQYEIKKLSKKSCLDFQVWTTERFDVFTVTLLHLLEKVCGKRGHTAIPTT